MTAEQLRTLMPAADVAAWAPALTVAMAAAGIDTPLRQAHFLGQLGHESRGLTVLVENLNYSADGLLKTFRKYFTAEQALAYARRPEHIANRVYAKRMGNGDESSGDGWRFRGHGPIQITGRRNHRAAGLALGLDLEANPDLLLQPQHGARAAGWYWQTHGINVFADQDDVVAVTKAVNGGTIGLDDRKARTEAAKAVLFVASSRVYPSGGCV